MIVTCPHCHRSIASAETDGPPLFCMYCGHKLRDHRPGSSAAGMETAPFSPALDSDDDDLSLDPAKLPETIGGYRLLQQLGSGGMGTVYEAEGLETGAHVAIKLLSPRLASSVASVERFKQEGRLASQLAHPRCVFVISADTDAGRPYIVMELMPGQTLKDLVEKRGPLPTDEAIGYVLDVIDGLAEAHRLGMIHRDMKPSNCFLTADGRVKVGDFGLSKSLTEVQDRHLTNTGAFLGTVLFASPEQIRGEPLDYGSDLYSVCATLYYLLSGEAPYQHESLTAALAKAISEDPPSLCQKRIGISRALEQVVLKGLERDRERRWQSLDDLREALINLLPSRRHPARPRALIAAYILDSFAIAILSIPANFLIQWLRGRENYQFLIFAFDDVSIAILLPYFSFFEGIGGATPGKWLLGLRVSRLGQTHAPGIAHAFLRTTVFHFFMYGMTTLPEHLVEWLGAAHGSILAGLAFALSAAALAIQLRKRFGFRGLHDFASHCHVTQRPLPARKLRLAIRSVHPLQVLPSPPSEALPAVLGNYSIRGRLVVQSSGEQVWLGQDAALLRLVVIWLRPVHLGPLPHTEASRPTRLRRLSGGTITWSHARYEWIAFAAPLGCPLRDAINPRQPLPWGETRFLLVQLLDELRAAEVDGTLPQHLGLDQVWVEPNGRLQLLDCPLLSTHSSSLKPLGLLREVVSLTLEGVPRSTSGAVRAPLPTHAFPIVDQLFTDGGYRELAELHQGLADTDNHSPEVTPAMRAAQLGIEIAIVCGPLVSIYVLTICMGLFLTIDSTVHLEATNNALEIASDHQKYVEFARTHDLPESVNHQQLTQRLKDYRSRLENEVEVHRSQLFSPQRLMLRQFNENQEGNPRRAEGYPAKVRRVIRWATAPKETPRGKSMSPWEFEETPVLAVLLVIPLGLILGAAFLRGGISFILTGIAVIRLDGRRATRQLCALRAILVWFPVTALLYGSTALQIFEPAYAYLALGLWLAAVGLLPIQFVIALRFPTRPPQDRLMRTCLMPA